MRHLPRQPTRMGGEIEEPDPASIGIGGPGKIENELDQRIGQLDGPCRRHMRQHLAGEGLGDRADAQQGGAIGRRTARAGTLAEAADRYGALAHRADHQGRDLGLDEQDLTGKIDNLVKHWVSMHASAPFPATLAFAEHENGRAHRRRCARHHTA